jgi:hypothetical protein
MSYTGLDAGNWNEKAQAAIRYGAILSRVCGGISQELQNLYAIEERLRNATDKGLHIVIEHVESPWRPAHEPSADSETEALSQDISPSQSQSAET